MALPILARAAFLAASLLLALVAPPAAQAAFPAAGASYTVHDHKTKGKNWHVEVEVTKKRRLFMRTIVIYDQQCKATPVVTNFRIDLKGRINIIDQEFDLPKGEKGRWTVRAQFTSTHKLKGVFQITTPTCDSGARVFEAHSGEHEHSKHHSGTRPGEFPALASASTTARSQVRDLWRNTLRAADELFPFYESALAMKFRRYPLKWKRPLLFHVRRDGYAKDKIILDPWRPESLVYWWPKKGSPVLLGFMYRAPLGKPPKFGGNLMAWHSHVENGSRGDNQMTHVWLTGDVRSALANCLPVEQLEKRIKSFRFSRPSHGAGHESQRCRG